MAVMVMPASLDSLGGRAEAVGSGNACCCTAGPAAHDGQVQQPPCIHVVPAHAALVTSGAPATSGNARGRVGFAAALAVAVLVHAGGLLALEHRLLPALGAGGFDPQATSVEVELLSASALQSLVQRPAAAGSAAGPIDLREGEAAPITTGSLTPPSPPPEAAAPPGAPPAAVLDAKPEPVEPDALALPAAEKRSKIANDARPEAPLPERHDVETSERPPVPKEPAQEAKPAAPAAAAAAAPAGGAAVRALDDPRPQTGSARASPGQIAAFARGVAGALAKTVPRGVRGAGRGTVLVAFAVAEDGGVAEVRVTRSSGSLRLDEIAVVAVRNTRFPVPPPGMPPAARTFEQPYHFR